MTKIETNTNTENEFSNQEWLLLSSQVNQSVEFNAIFPNKTQAIYVIEPANPTIKRYSDYFIKHSFYRSLISFSFSYTFF